jgi:anti-sigma factor (TIGR02949 family)
MIDCREAVRRMWAYFEHALEPAQGSELEEHLVTCRRCCGELEFGRQLRAMVASRHREPVMPPEVRSRIELLLAGLESVPEGTPEPRA